MTAKIARAASMATTAALVLCAITVTILTVRRELRPATASSTTGAPQPDWLAFAADGHRIGPALGKVALVEFADFQCPACRLLEQRIAEARKNVDNGFVVVYRHLPLDIHPYAEAAAKASECAAAQGRFDAMHNALFRHQRALGDASWKMIAEEAGVRDLDAFEHCNAAKAMPPNILRDVAAAESLHATGTPTVLVGGRRFSGVPPQEQLESLIRDALRSAR